MKLKEQEEEIKKIEEMEKEEAENEKKEAIIAMPQHQIPKPAKNGTSNLLELKQKEMKESEERLKQTKLKLAELQKQKEAISQKNVTKSNITSIIPPVNAVQPNMATPYHSSQPQKKDEPSQILSSKKSET